MILSSYRSQVDLLLQILPFVAKEENFALKGGTAINLFVRDLPRLSVDIDLTYILFDSRESSLKNIHDGLVRIKSNLERAIRDIKVHTVPIRGAGDVKLNCQHHHSQIKIEVNTVTRGILFPVRKMQVHERVQEEFGKFAAINVVSHAELYGGKICAALDRQHPRDLFDVKLLLENEGIDNHIIQGLLLGFLSHYKPIHELLDPILKDQKSAYENQFSGMTSMEYTYEEYEKTRIDLIKTIKSQLTEDDKNLILSFNSGAPKWELSTKALAKEEFPSKNIKDFPAVKWKLQNIRKLIKENPDKHKEMVRALQEVLD